MSEQVRRMVGLENWLRRARRRLRECEREEGRPDGPRGARYQLLVKRVRDELHAVGDRAHLQEYLDYMEGTFLPRLGSKVEETKGEMVEAARAIVDGRAHLLELRAEFTDAMERVRMLRERLGLDPFRPQEIHFGLGVHAPNAERHEREAHDLVKEFLKR